jgi:2-polyprenyl-3-methyl-5-hydroxy-6-metoxy-1,4-benzoquinol methylase
LSLIKRNTCPACRNTSFKEIYSLPYNSIKMSDFIQRYYKGLINDKKLEKFEYKLLECRYCSLIFQEQVPGKNFSQELYEEIINQEDSLFKKNDFEKKYHKKLLYEINLIKGIFKKENNEISILDFGAGWGFWIDYFKNNNFNVSAFEVSESRINFMKKNQINIISNIENIKNKFDLIYSEETFEHITNPRETLIALSKILKVGGYIMLRFPSNFLFKFKLDKKYNPSPDCAHPLEHINLFRKKSFDAMVENSNLEIISLKSQFNLSIKNILKDLKNFIYFDSILIKKINE